MNGLSAAGLADLAGVTEAEVRWLVDLGVLVARHGAGPFPETDVQKVRLATACERAGLPMARIAAAIRADRLSFAFLEASPYRRWAVRSPRTYRAVSEETGIPMDTLASALEAMGFARMGPEEPMREDELEIVPLLQQGFSSGLLDLAWLTQLGRAHADALAETLALLVDRSAREHGGVPVKWLGDGVMVHYREPAGAVLSALDLVAQLPGAGLPPAHVGVAAGPVVVQGGDYFGHTVNLAARIAASAGASRVLVSERVAERAPPQGVTFVELGWVQLEGISRPVRLLEARRAWRRTLPPRLGKAPTGCSRPAGPAATGNHTRTSEPPIYI
jgi:hypothetical protein